MTPGTAAGRGATARINSLGAAIQHRTHTLGKIDFELVLTEILA